ncbi:SUR7-domain-containing protein [Aulographum hederae CBS 113979]|uniref:SUR7-domain-containing protein n=1 Tax=Aulographum hederae CBS 113979 TaxID=1176131 RepID=A0A6G1GQ34_9PEZI|nr:SUR7-domain-containing protein [Aulographum hederae CBS 113979]
MAARPLLGLLSLFFLAGGILLQFLVILSGTAYHNPLNQVFFIEANTDGIPGAPNPARWTYFSICGVSDSGKNTNCGPVHPALPFQPQHRDDFGTETGVPEAFIGTNHYYYLSRFMFAFYLIALFFAVIGLFTGLLALCTRLGAYLSGLNSFIALFFQTITAALMTACFVQGRDAFRRAGLPAHVGVKAFAFTWTAMACFLLATVFFCLGGAAGREKGAVRSKRGGFMGRKASTKSRGSFVSSDRGRKDEYEP